MLGKQSGQLSAHPRLAQLREQPPRMQHPVAWQDLGTKRTSPAARSRYLQAVSWGCEGAVLSGAGIPDGAHPPVWQNTWLPCIRHALSPLDINFSAKTHVPLPQSPFVQPDQWKRVYKCTGYKVGSACASPQAVFEWVVGMQCKIQIHHLICFEQIFLSRT